MSKKLLVIIFLLMGTGTIAQQYLILQKQGGIKNYKYRTGDQIMFSLPGNENVFSGELTLIGDSTFVLDNTLEINIKAVQSIYRTRHFFRWFSKVLVMAGVVYIGVEAVNGVINNDSPMISKQTAIAASVMVGTGLILNVFKTRKFKIGDKYHLKILNFDTLNE